MSDREARELMQRAWEKRRNSFDAPPEQKLALLNGARDDLKRAAEMCRDGGSAVSLAHAIHLLANIEVDLDRPEQARPLWEEAVTILRGTDDALQLAHKVRHLGDLHRRAGRLAEADGCYAEALTLYRAEGAKGSLDFANAIRRMALLKECQDQPDEALAIWRETRAAYAAIDLSAGVEEADAAIERLGN